MERKEKKIVFRRCYSGLKNEKQIQTFQGIHNGDGWRQTTGIPTSGERNSLQLLVDK